MSDQLTENERDKTAHREFLAEIDATYPAGWYVAVDGLRVIFASADFDELLADLDARGKDPRNTMVVEASARRPEYVTIFI